MRNTKCYIAGAITGLPEEEYKSNFAEAKEQVIKLGYKPVVPIELPHEHGKSWSDYMKEDLAAMLKCECVFACKNWMQSKGARIEVGLAYSLNMFVFYQENIIPV